MNRKMLVIVAVMLGAWAGAAHACMMMEGARTSPSWQAEYEALGNQYESVGALSGFDGTYWYNRACGVRIHENWVLTAAHAVEEGGQLDQRYAFSSSAVRFQGAPYNEAEQVFLHPQYTAEIVSPDLALLYFPDGLGDIPIAERFRGTDQIGQLLTMVGYGRPAFPSTGWLEPDGKRRGFEAYLTELGGSWMGAPSYQALARFSSVSGLHLNGLTTPGHSGGGMFTADGELMGIMGFYTGTNYGGQTGGTRVSLYNDWIDATIPEPATLILLSFGAVLLGRRRA